MVEIQKHFKGIFKGLNNFSIDVLTMKILLGVHSVK